MMSGVAPLPSGDIGEHSLTLEWPCGWEQSRSSLSTLKNGRNQDASLLVVIGS